MAKYFIMNIIITICIQWGESYRILLDENNDARESVNLLDTETRHSVVEVLQLRSMSRDHKLVTLANQKTRHDVHHKLRLN